MHTETWTYWRGRVSRIVINCLYDGDILRPGSIVKGDPGYPDQREPKVRPLLVISNNILHSNTQLVVCVGITTNRVQSPYLIPIPRKEIQEGQLKEESQVMCMRIAAVPQSALRKIATMTPALYDRILRKIKDDVIEWELPGGKTKNA